MDWSDHEAIELDAAKEGAKPQCYVAEYIY